MLTRGLTLLLVLGMPLSAWARPEHKAALGRYYGQSLARSLFACATCHEVALGADEVKLAEESPPHNAFGKRLSGLGEALDARRQPSDLISRLKQVAEEDTDGDGGGNELELLAGHAPGNAADCLQAEEIAEATAVRERFHRQYRWDAWSVVKRPQLPAVQNAGWVRNPIDAFVAAQHEAHQLVPRPEAPRHVLLRRVYLDLIGLPPTRDQLREFLADTSPDAYEKVVEGLLASPQYGERWGRHWMDVWRYSDWAGYGKQIRDSQPHIWRWRDWIIESLNRDLPYDQMIEQMLAADELYPDDPQALRATGYLVRNYKLLSREQWMQDVVDHTALAFLGTTVKCARCHDHLYDSISQREYYGLRAIFEPHQVRLDRVPGQVDPAKEGLARVFDADAAVATYLYHRGDERTPDKEHPVSPGVPQQMGGPKFVVQPVDLPAAAACPDKLPFVVADLLAAARQEVDAARARLRATRQKVNQVELAAGSPPLSTVPETEQSLQKAKQELAAAEFELLLMQARHASLEATLHVEQLEDAGTRSKDGSAWEQAAMAAATAQRQLAALEAHQALAMAQTAVEKASAAWQQAQQKASEQLEDAGLNKALEKAAADKTAAEKKVAEVQQQLTSAEDALQSPLTTAYTKRQVKIYPATSTGRRLALARWIAHREHPLTARVAVNHIWLRHFGQALVETVFDFGQNGRPPANPALVDWLAAEFMEPSHFENPDAAQPAPWSMRHLHRLIVNSATYRMHSTPDPANIVRDADNRHQWRVSPRRLEAEAVRDSILHVAGQLDMTLGGPEIDQQQGLRSKRRSLYFRHAAEKQVGLLKLFDAPAVNECYQRKESIVPQQALALINSELTLVQSRLLARSLLQESEGDAAAFIAAAFETVLARPATAEELNSCQEFLEKQARLFSQQTTPPSGTENLPEANLADGSRPAADFPLRARENLVHVLLNHHEFVTIR